LSSAAQEYDESLVRSVKTAPSAARRSIYYTEFEPHQIEDKFFNVTYDIDTSPSDILEVNVHGFGGHRLNADQWVVSLRKHKRNGTSEIKQARPSFWNIKLRPPPGGTVQGPPWRNFGRPSGGRFTPRNCPADTAVN
jgi:hypothetical protein